jgi:hypothetical protein
MGIQYQNLDSKTRGYMLKEIELDCQNKKLYKSTRLSENGENNWEPMLKEAAKAHDDVWLANELRMKGCLRSQESRTMRGRGVMCRVPFTAPETLSEGEFNRFYCRGLCARAKEEGISKVIVYRGKQVEEPRPESEAKIGQSFDPSALLDDLRTAQGVEPALGIPKGPNSGISIKLP